MTPQLLFEYIVHVGIAVIVILFMGLLVWSIFKD